MGESGIESLPEGCIAHAISFTSPRGACCSSAVSPAFRSAAASDTVWDRFLPDDLESILSRAAKPLRFSSKREHFCCLCKPILIDGGKMSFSLDRSSGAKCYMLSARELMIAWGENPFFLELDLRARFQPRWNYRIRMWFRRFLRRRRARALPELPEEAKKDEDSREFSVHCPRTREDGWMEVELGEFYNDHGEDGAVEMIFVAARGRIWKGGLIVEGIEIKPRRK